MKVALFTTYYRPDPIGIAVYATEIAEHLAGSGHDVRVVTSFPHYPSWTIDRAYRGVLRTTEHHNGVEVHRLWLYVPRTQSVMRRGLYETTSLAHGFTAMPRRGDAEVILSVVPNLANAAVSSWCSWRLGIPHIMFVQDLSGN